jgi:hypothetical protein
MNKKQQAQQNKKQNNKINDPMFDFSDLVKTIDEMEQKVSNKQEISVQSDSKSLESTLKACNVDLKVWDVDHYTIEESSKGYNYKIYLKKKHPSMQDIKELAKELASFGPSSSPIKYKTKEGGMLLEFAPFDLHWGKLAWAEESGEDYDMKEATIALNKSIDYTLQAASKFNISKIIFPFGNDFFQIDNEQNTTTAGTRQDADSRFKKILREGRKIVIDTIEKLKKIAPVDVIIVTGNHGGLSEFMLGDLLEVKYQNDKNVTINNSAASRKYYQYGNTLIGYTHGDQEKITDLVGIMATESAQNWAQSKYRFWHLGHFHTMQTKELQGVRVEWLPSLSATDAWHKKKGYVNNTRGVVSSLYDKNMGMVHRIYFNL